MALGSTLFIRTPPAAGATAPLLRSQLFFLNRSVGLPKPHLSPSTTFFVTAPNRILSAGSVLARDSFRAAAGGTMLQDAGATVAVMAGAYGLVSTFDSLTQRNVIDQAESFASNLPQKEVLSKFSDDFRVKINLSGKQSGLFDEFEQKTGPHFIGVAFYGLLANFQISTSTEARYFAALVPLANGLRLLVHGLSLVTNEDLIKAVTREGKPEELLRGPLYYVLVLILSSLLFWRESPVGVISLAMMCGGDGVADIMGRRFGSMKIPYNKQKSWAGSISMFIFGFLISIGMLYYFSMLGYFELDWTTTIGRVALISLVATMVESLPTTGGVDDNLSVPLVSMTVHAIFDAIFIMGHPETVSPCTEVRLCTSDPLTPP